MLATTEPDQSEASDNEVYRSQSYIHLRSTCTVELWHVLDSDDSLLSQTKLSNIHPIPENEDKLPINLRNESQNKLHAAGLPKTGK